MDAAQFRALLEALPNGSEALDFHISSIEAEKSRGITEVNRRNKENEGLRKFKQAFENLGYDGTTDLNEYANSLKATTESVSQKDGILGDLQNKVKRLEGDFSKTQAELAAERQAAAELKLKAKHSALKGVMIESLKDKVYGHDFVINDLIQSGRVDLVEDKPVFVNDDKTTVPFEDGVNKLLESRPDIVKNTQRPGGGAQPNGGNPSGPQSDDQARLQRLRQMTSGGLSI